jgi:hypothetical protein
MAIWMFFLGFEVWVAAGKRQGGLAVFYTLQVQPTRLSTRRRIQSGGNV